MISLLGDKLTASKIILASSSPRRKEILENLGLKFSVISPNVDENLIVSNYSSVSKYVEALAELKANAVLNTVENKKEDYIIIAADTVIAFEGSIIGKPTNQEDAIRILECLRGKTHQVITGVCIHWLRMGVKRRMDIFHEKTNVKMASLDMDIIRAYVNSGEPMDKAGAYGIQGMGCSLIEKIDGDYFTVVGLPAFKLCQYLHAGCQDL